MRHYTSKRINAMFTVLEMKKARRNPIHPNIRQKTISLYTISTSSLPSSPQRHWDHRGIVVLGRIVTYQFSKSPQAFGQVLLPCRWRNLFVCQYLFDRQKFLLCDLCVSVVKHFFFASLCVSAVRPSYLLGFEGYFGWNDIFYNKKIELADPFRDIVDPFCRFNI